MFVTRNYVYETGSMTGNLGKLKWESLKKRRKDNRLILLYKGLKGKARIPTDDLIPKTRRGRNQHSLAFQNLRGWSCEPNNQLNVCTTSVTEGEAVGVKLVEAPSNSLLTVSRRWF